ncbi:MAG: GGDEF domain-containing protein [Candidatus Eisenbacteria bacterium]|nr:GGDEF domain-containing protein [Candidatus Eisenbacteria bacterium]
MKKHTLTFRALLEGVLPVHRLSPAEQRDIALALTRGDDSELEELATRSIERLQALGYLKFLGEAVEGEEKVLRYRNLLSSEYITIRLQSRPVSQGVLLLKLPLQGARVRATMDQVKGLLSLDERILTSDDRLLTGVNDVLKFILDTAKEVTACDGVAFCLSRESQDKLRYLEPVTQGLEPAPAYVEEWVIDKGHLVYVVDVAAAPPEARIAGEPFQSVAAMRVGGEGHPLKGAILACSAKKDFFTEQKLVLLSLLADTCTALLARTERLGRLVFVDSLTQVYNRSYFDVQLGNEIARAAREKKCMALCIVDIDNFKTFNSRFGYEGGNQVLKEVARILRTDIRPFDSVARWGGEEFAVLLTAPVTETQAVAICERLRTAIEAMSLQIRDLSGNQSGVQITVSIGGAVYPDDAENAGELWRKANESLLEAKRPPKNKTLFWAELGLKNRRLLGEGA